MHKTHGSSPKRSFVHLSEGSYGECVRRECGDDAIERLFGYFMDMRTWRARAALFWIAGMAHIGPAFAVQVNQYLDINGAVRARFDRDSTRRIAEAGLDTVMLGATYDDGKWMASARHRWYGGDYPFQYKHVGGVSFTEYAWVGYRLDDERSMQLGLNKVPFGLSPLFSSSFYETLGNVIGIEDIYLVGGKYAHKSADWDVQLGYYTKPAWPGRGASNGASYSVVVTPPDQAADGSRVVERQVVVGRVARQFDGNEWTSEIGLSLYRSGLKNLETQRWGARHLLGVHYQGQRGPWGLRLQWARQHMRVDDPLRRETVGFGGFDGTFQVAARGTLHVLDISHTHEKALAHGRIKGLRHYVTYSRFDKSVRSYRPSQRAIVGTSASIGSWYVAVEWMNGSNDPYLGGSDYVRSLAEGGTGAWRNQFYANVGYYF